MVRSIAIVGVAGIATMLVLAATRPSSFRIARATRIQAPPDEIFALINDFRRRSAWSPFEKLDPAMKRTLSGAPAGKNAVYEWEGNAKAGKGRMEITDTADLSRVRIQLDFLKPFEAHNTAEFTLDAQGDATTVTWVMYGPTPYVAKIIHLFVSMERMVGKDFETGLANLKTLAERCVASRAGRETAIG
jgi:hypothetical protein